MKASRSVGGNLRDAGQDRRAPRQARPPLHPQTGPPAAPRPPRRPQTKAALHRSPRWAGAGYITIARSHCYRSRPGVSTVLARSGWRCVSAFFARRPGDCGAGNGSSCHPAPRAEVAEAAGVAAGSGGAGGRGDGQTSPGSGAPGSLRGRRSTLRQVPWPLSSLPARRREGAGSGFCRAAPQPSAGPEAPNI